MSCYLINLAPTDFVDARFRKLDKLNKCSIYLIQKVRLFSSNTALALD